KDRPPCIHPGAICNMQSSTYRVSEPLPGSYVHGAVAVYKEPVLVCCGIDSVTFKQNINQRCYRPPVHIKERSPVCVSLPHKRFRPRNDNIILAAELDVGKRFAAGQPYLLGKLEP